MKLPLTIRFDYYDRDRVLDAEHRVVFDFSANTERKFMNAIVRKMNRHWRWRLFGQQPFVYTRADWLFEKSVKQ